MPEKAEKNLQFAELLTKALDQELTEAEQRLFHELISRHPEWQQEWEDQKKLKEVMQTMKLKNPPSEIWDTYWARVYNRIERGIGWMLFSIGAIVLLVYGLYVAITALLSARDVSALIKAAIMMVLVGLIILLISVAREKWFVRKTDPYKEVQR